MADINRYVSRGVEGKSLVTRRIAGESILVPMTSDVVDLNSVYTLNDVGSLVWALFDGDRPIQEIADAVSAEFEVTPAQAAEDIEELVSALEANGLARRSAKPIRNE
jgi:hypothetical protein